MKYAILEWPKDDVEGDWADVIAKDQDESTAKWLLDICPEHLHREYITMSDYEIIKRG